MVLETIATGRESTKFNPRDNLRPVDIDWLGYERTVETVRRSQWQVSGIARTLVDAADDAEVQPAPSPEFLERYAEVLDEIGLAVDHFGLRDEAEQAEVDRHLRAAIAALDELGAEVRETTPGRPQRLAGLWRTHPRRRSGWRASCPPGRTRRRSRRTAAPSGCPGRSACASWVLMPVCGDEDTPDPQDPPARAG